MDVLLAVLVALIGCVAGQQRDLEVVFQWPVLSYSTPSGYPADPDFRPTRSVFNSLEVDWDRIFVTTPRIWKGNPTTLGWIPRSRSPFPTDPSPKIQAYPSWEWHANAVRGNVTDCSGLISVFRARADRCNRLWVLDSGVMDSLVTFSVVCPPKILIFDLATDQLIRLVTLPRDVLRPNSLLSNMVLDDQNPNFSNGGFGSCDEMFVYMSDTTNPGIVVYDSARDSAWRLQHPFMFPDPNFGTYKVAGESFTLMDGILGMALSPGRGYQSRLYFQPFASDRLLSIPTSVLQRGPNPGDDAELPVTLAGTKSSQAAGLAVDPRDGSLIFSPVSETAIAAWLPGSPDFRPPRPNGGRPTPKPDPGSMLCRVLSNLPDLFGVPQRMMNARCQGYRVLAYNPEVLQMVLDFRPADRDNGNIWLLSTRMQKFFRRTVNPQEINLRILRLVSRPDIFNNTLLFN